MLDAQPTSTCNTTIIEAARKHKHSINQFLNQKHLTHQHLDWFTPLDWLGHRPYLIEKYNETIQAILLSAPEVNKSTWIRMFSIRNKSSLACVWERLLNKTIAILDNLQINQLAALGFSSWFIDLLLESNFSLQNKIVVLEWKDNVKIHSKQLSPVDIRLMHREDLPEIEQIDHLAFPALWQNSLEGLSNAYHQPGISTVAIDQDRIIGYQISTAVAYEGHLARLAVHPDYQEKHVGSGLVQDLLNRFITKGFSKITVNTQINNFASLAIYKKFGFSESQWLIPVFIREI